jgi:GNAT superfamily N-acetyltransferase
MKIAKELEVDGFLFSTDKKRLQVNYIHQFLSKHSYWAMQIPLKVVEESIANSLCVGIYRARKQIGFARIITDYASFAYLADVFVDESFRGRNLSKKLMDFIFSLGFVNGLRRFLLATRDAHSLYERSGFKPLAHAERFMEIHNPDIYSTDESVRHSQSNLNP